MDHPLTHLLREARLFVHTPGVVHVGIAQLLIRLLLKRGRGWLM
jgi:hypothetical protein